MVLVKMYCSSIFRNNSSSRFGGYFNSAMKYMMRKNVFLCMGIALLVLGTISVYFAGSDSQGTGPLFYPGQFEDDRGLLLQEAEKNHIEVSDEEVDAEIEQVLDFTGQSGEIEKLLDSSDMSLEELKRDIGAGIAINKLLENELDLSEVYVTEEELDELLGVSGDMDNSDPLIVAVKERSEQRLLLVKKSILISQYLEELGNNE